MMPFLAMAQKSKDELKAGESITYAGIPFYLGYSSHPVKDYYFQEYFPKGEKPDSYRQMFTVSLHYSKSLTPAQAVEAKAKELGERKKTDQCCNYAVMENNGEYMMDFLVSAPDKDDPDALSVVEFDIHRYRQVEVNGKKAIQLMFYSRRAYGDDIIPFLTKLKTERDNMLKDMIQADVCLSTDSQLQFAK